MTEIRLATPADAAAIAEIYRPAVTDSAISFELEPPDAAAMADRIATTLQRTPWLVCADTAGILGYAYGSRHRDRPAYQWSVEVSAYVRQDRRRGGVGRALYTALFAVLAQQGFRNAYAGITLPNPASVGLHLAVGFSSIGVFRNIGFKHGVWHDVAWLERQLAPYMNEPPEPIPLPALLQQTDLTGAFRLGEAQLVAAGAARPHRE